MALLLPQKNAPEGRFCGLECSLERWKCSGFSENETTRTDVDTTARLVDRIVAEAGVRPVVATTAGVEVQRRRSGERSWLFVLNHTEVEATVAASGTDIVTGSAVSASVTVPPGGVAVVREGGDG